MLLNAILGGLAALSFGLQLWQWWVARRFPLHLRRPADPAPPPLTLLKPLRGCDDTTEACLRSWFAQDYAAPLQILFGVASAEDPVCAIVRRLIAQFPERDAQLRVCGPLTGMNLKVSKLALLEPMAAHATVVISDADVRVPPDFLSQVVMPLQSPEVGLVNCFYRLANPTTVAMQWEAIAINADFWSQVLQSQSLKPIDFALGAVMVARREQLARIGGFGALADCLADDYQLGHRIAALGRRIALCPVVVECWSGAMGWTAVWKHQLRWARTVRVCQPAPYFFSVLSNGTLWPWLWAALQPGPASLTFALAAWLARAGMVWNLQRRLGSVPVADGAAGRAPGPLGLAACLWLAPLKDVLQAAIWGMAFLGNQIEWRGERMRLLRDGRLVQPQQATDTSARPEFTPRQRTR